MSGFKDTFTKEDGKDGMLGYDDTAFYYFASSVLLCVAAPWTFNIIYNAIFPGREVEKDFPAKTRGGSVYRYCKTAEMEEKVNKARRDVRRFSGGQAFLTILKFTVLASIWGILYFVACQTGSGKEIKRFDPFQILEVSSSASDKDIKKAYRKLSLIYHPDKNQDDPMAQHRFIEITKAYGALTDPLQKANYEKYGNPDGPQVAKVGIGLPQFLLEKDNHLMILCIFFFLLLFVVPMTFICYYQRTKNYAANGVMIETLQFLGYYINESTRLKNCPELLAASAESRGMVMRESDNTAMKPIANEVKEHTKRKYAIPIIVRNQFLLSAHMQRLHHLMTPELREDSDELLRYSMKITQAMVEIACMREWFFTAQAMIEFRRSLVQALDIKDSQLLQIPHFTEESLTHTSRGKNKVSSLHDFLSKDPDQRKGVSKMDDNQLLDIEAFCSHISAVTLEAKVEVEDEGEIVVGDVATVSCKLTRKNLKEGEAIGPVHAPLFPEPKFEEWWLFLTEAQATTRIIAFERLRDTDREFGEKLRFQVSRPGKHQFVLHALCDSYAGIDQKAELNFNVLNEDEVKREIVVHQDDEELDLQPTLFQQFMGELNREEESEEEEEEDNRKKKSLATTKPKVLDKDKDLSAEKNKSKTEDDNESKSDAKSDTKSGGGDDDDDSSSSSESED